MNLSQAANELRSMAEKLESAGFYLRHPDGQKPRGDAVAGSRKAG